LLVGDLILCEVLQGRHTDVEARLVEDALREFEVVPFVDAELAVKAAANCRFLSPRGITIRKTIDLLIGTFCIERGHTLLHSDRDFARYRDFSACRLPDPASGSGSRIAELQGPADSAFPIALSSRRRVVNERPNQMLGRNER
jgi:predicted nucleic acid-binding protein